MKTKQTFGLWWVIAAAAALGVYVYAAPIITPVGAVASHEYAAATAADVIDASRLNGLNQLIPGTWADNWLFDGAAYASGSMGYDTSQHWIYVDLGAEYVLDEIRIWNYFDNNATDVSGRGAKYFHLYTGVAGATLPTGPQSFAALGSGWTVRVLGNGTTDPFMTKAPQATVPIGPTDVFLQAQGLTAQYVAIDVGGFLWNGSGGNSLGGLGHIQVTGQSLIIEQKTINRVELMPNIPSSFAMKDWKAVALGFDQLAFDFEATGEYLPLIWWDTTRKNFDRNIFALPDHVGRFDTAPTFGDGSTHSFWSSMGSVLGATLVGLDKSHQWCASTRTFQNWVLQCENYFNLDNGENVFLWATGTDSGNSWLYELTPTVWMSQINYYYPSVGDIENNLKITTNRWYDACVAMGGSTTPWTVPDFDWTAFDFDTMTPVDNGGWTEPDAAGGFAWIGYIAWVRWQDPNHLNMADWGLGFLENASENPLMSANFPYGAYTAARMNAELDRNYDLHKLLNWCFDESEHHSYWGVIVNNWGGYDIYGLWGQVDGSPFGGGGYAFAMETFNMVGTLLPVVRYDDGYARSIGKWVLNAANNARMFYPDALPPSHQSSSFWTGDPDGVIGYEGLGKTGPAGQSPYARGDAIDPFNAGATDLGVYGGALVGILGGTLSPTNQVHIFQIDCLKTDYYHATAYPTYLYYNPETTARMINIDVGPVSKDLYETASNTFLAQSVTGTIDFYIPADSAVVLVVAPAGGTRSFVNGRKLLINGVVVDYSYRLEDWENSFVDMESFVSMAASWLQTGDTMPQDLNRDKIVNLKDVAILANRWQQD